MSDTGNRIAMQESHGRPGYAVVCDANGAERVYRFQTAISTVKWTPIDGQDDEPETVTALVKAGYTCNCNDGFVGKVCSHIKACSELGLLVREPSPEATEWTHRFRIFGRAARFDPSKLRVSVQAPKNGQSVILQFRDRLNPQAWLNLTMSREDISQLARLADGETVDPSETLIPDVLTLEA